MPALTRKPIILLPHRARSGLFQTREGAYIAHVRPDDGKEVKRRLGTDRERALALFQSLLAEIESVKQERENPLLIPFLTEPFLDSQRHLKSFCYTEKRVRAIVRFLEARYPNLRLAEVRKHHAVALTDFYGHLSPRIRNGNLQKLKQALNLAADLELLDGNPLGWCKGLRFDNRRIRTCDLDGFVRLVQAARGDVRDMLIVLGLTGLRPGNVFQLRDEEVEGNLIRIPPKKMKNGRWGAIPASSFIGGCLPNAAHLRRVGCSPPGLTGHNRRLPSERPGRVSRGVRGWHGSTSMTCATSSRRSWRSKARTNSKSGGSCATWGRA